MHTNFHFVPLDSQQFHPLFGASAEQLAQRGAQRMIASTAPGYPCRVSLVDAQPGETVLLLTHVHHDVRTPYRASGPIFVRAAAEAARTRVDEVPAFLRHRHLSVRGYAAEGILLDAEVSTGVDLEQAIRRLFGNAAIRYLHVHNAAQGCFLCCVERR